MFLTATPKNQATFAGTTFSSTLTFHQQKRPKSGSFLWGFAQVLGTFSFEQSQIGFDVAELGRIRGKGVVVGAGFGGIALEKELERERNAFALLSTAPSILFYDLNLKEGEERKVSYEIELPSNLPPSFRGKTFKVQYKLVICIQPVGVAKPLIFQLPLRIYASIGDILSQRVFNVSSPIIITDDIGIVGEVVKPKLVNGIDMESLMRPLVAESEEEEMTLAQKLTRHCQKSGKISVDICKGSDLVAHFTLVRGAFRVGDTVLGLLDFSKCTVACFQLSAFLEQTETVDEKHVPSNSTSTKGVRTVLAQHHCCVINTSRMDISLKIPSTATPDFKTSVASVSYNLRLEFITSRGPNPKLLEPVAAILDPTVADMENAHDHHAQNFTALKLVDRVDVEAFECVLGIKVYPRGDDVWGGNGKQFEVGVNKV